MPKRTPVQVADHIRKLLREGSSAEHAAGVQWFFKEEIRSHGWYTAPLRRLAAKLRHEILAEGGLKLLLDTADQLFSGEYIEERAVAVFLLQRDVAKGVPPLRKVADARDLLGRSRRARVSSPRSDASGRFTSRPAHLPLGEIRQSVAAPRLRRRADSRRAEEALFPGH